MSAVFEPIAFPLDVAGIWAVCGDVLTAKSRMASRDIVAVPVVSGPRRESVIATLDDTPRPVLVEDLERVLGHRGPVYALRVAATPAE
jgi:hypothetical protein